MSLRQTKNRQIAVSSLQKKISATEPQATDQLPRGSTIEQVNHLQQEILRTPGEIHNPTQALLRAYEMLSDQQKIDFLLAGGAEQLVRYQLQRVQQNQETGKDISSDSVTGSLPIIC